MVPRHNHSSLSRRAQEYYHSSSNSATIRPDPPQSNQSHSRSSRHSSSPSSTSRGSHGHSASQGSQQLHSWLWDRNEFDPHRYFLVNGVSTHRRTGEHVAAFDNMWRAADGSGNGSSRNSSATRGGSSRGTSRSPDDGRDHYLDDGYYSNGHSPSRRHDGGGSGGAGAVRPVSSRHRSSASTRAGHHRVSDSHIQHHRYSEVGSSRSRDYDSNHYGRDANYYHDDYYHD